MHEHIYTHTYNTHLHTPMHIYIISLDNDTHYSFKTHTLLITKPPQDTPSCCNVTSTVAATFTHLTSSMMGKALVTGLENSMCICKDSWEFSESPMNWWTFTSSRSNTNMAGFLLCCCWKENKSGPVCFGRSKCIMKQPAQPEWSRGSGTAIFTRWSSSPNSIVTGVSSRPLRIGLLLLQL